MSYKFVIISDKYIDYLRKTEPRVMSNKADSRVYHRKYLGIIEKLNGFNYFIPLSSPKPKDYAKNGKIKNDSLLTIYMKDSKRLYGTLRFNNMIPVLDSALIEIDIANIADVKYRRLLQNQYNSIRADEKGILRTAEYLRKLIFEDENNISEHDKIVKQRCCNLVLLEEIYIEWK